MVRAGGEYRVQIYAGDAETLEIVELFLYASEVAAEKVVFVYHAVGVGLPVGLLAPLGVVDCRGLVLGKGSFAGATESVRENLIHNSAAQPQGSVTVFAANRQPPALALAHYGDAAAFKRYLPLTPRSVIFKMVADEALFFGRGGLEPPPFLVLALHSLPGERDILSAAAVRLKHKANRAALLRAGQDYSEGHFLTRAHCRAGREVIFFS